ncbi:acyltransferase family protein [Paenibacillus sp. NPDC058071]|uniref:acyltransferase family protein n=1 Tax=Paenibacillus sp. NPDC058071 TaxID=3346326 RepID=UPI0036DD2975
MTSKTGNGRRYMPGLDGFRAVAVLAVIAYHLNMPGMRGGLLGVTLFFVLSGYLITDILLSQHERGKRMNLKAFWLGRARRLLPAMLLTLAAVAIYLYAVDPGRLNTLKGDIGSSVLYVNNWWMIFHEVSYFESFGPPSPFGHLWSLAVEEQFYVLWPLLLLLLLHYLPKRGKAALAMTAAALVSAAMMAVLYDPSADPSRVYYGTDTRAFALLIGSALAVVWPSRKLNESAGTGSRIAIDAIGWSGLAVIVGFFVLANPYDAFLYRGGMLLFSIAVAVAVAALAHPAGRSGKWMGSAPLKWLGTRSYGIYLYHYPIIMLSTPVRETGQFDPLRSVLQVAATIAVAEMSYRWLEQPIRYGGVGKLLEPVRRYFKEHRIGSGAAVAALSLFVFGACFAFALNSGSIDILTVNAKQADMTAGAVVAKDINSALNTPLPVLDLSDGPVPKGNAVAKETTAGQVDESGTKDQAASKAPAVVKPPKAAVTPDPQNTPDGKGEDGIGNGYAMEDEETTPDKEKGGSSVGLPSPPQSPSPTKNPNTGSEEGRSEPSPNEKARPVAVTAIGDSVILDAAPYLEKLLPGIVIDGKIGRQMRQSVDVVEQLKEQQKLGDTVIIELGTNGAFTGKQLNKLLQSIGEERRVLLVNTRVPRNWQDTVNKLIAEAAAGAPNVTLVDWYAASEEEDDYFAADGVHLKISGAKAYAAMLADAVKATD